MTRRNPRIQGMRAIAVLLVLLYHAGLPGFRGGYVGVDVFFVISGFLITGLLVREFDEFQRIDLWAFYARRIRRLAPAALLVFALTLIAGTLLLSPWERWQLAKDTLSALVYFSNVWFASLQTDYLADASSSPLLHTWSLSVEEQFYLLWPLLLWLLMKGRKSWLVAGIAILSIVSFSLSAWLTYLTQPWAFFSMPTRVWEFGIGALVYLYGKRVRMPWCGELGLLALIVAAGALDDLTAYPGTAALLPVIGTAALLVWVQHPSDSLLAKALSSRTASVVGDASYSLYLWHWPLLVFTGTAFGKQGLFASALVISVSLLLALATLRIVENPVRFARAMSVAPSRAVAAWMIATVVGVGLGLNEWRAAKSAMVGPAQADIAKAREHRPVIYVKGCHAPILETKPMRCTYGNAEGRYTVVLLGDSHAAHWFPALEVLATQRGWRLIPLTKSACPAVSVTPFVRQLRRPYEECVIWRDLAFRVVEELQPQLVVLGSSNDYALEKEWANGLLATVNRLEKHASQIVVMADVPVPGFDVPTCLGRGIESRCSFKRRVTSLQNTERDSLHNTRATYVDLTDEICPDTVCMPTRNGKIIYSDSHHLTLEYSRMLAGELGRKLATF